MNQTEIYSFLTANPVFHLATLDGEQPRVRGMLLYRADEQGLVFHTGKMRELYGQLITNPKVELAFNNNSEDDLTQIRISGSVEPEEDLDLKREIVSNRQFLQPLVDRQGYDFLAVFRLAGGIASIWKMRLNLEPKTIVALS